MPGTLCDNDSCYEIADQTCERCGNRYCAAHADHESWHTRPIDAPLDSH